MTENFVYFETNFWILIQKKIFNVKFILLKILEQLLSIWWY